MDRTRTMPVVVAPEAPAGRPLLSDDWQRARVGTCPAGADAPALEVMLAVGPVDAGVIIPTGLIISAN